MDQPTRLRRRFTEMLKPLVRERRLEVWSDERVVTGYDWRPQLAEAIARSRAALLLVSPSFLASDFIMDQELPALIGHGVRLVPVLVRPCLWQQISVLEGVQWAHDPRRDGPVAGSVDPEGQIVRVCLELHELLAGDGVAPGEGGDSTAPQAAGQAAALVAGARPGELYGVPVLPRALVAREELAGLRATVLRAGDGVVGVTGAAMGLHGQGGIGKTVLAAAIARDEAVRRHFPNGVFWVTVGERADLVAAQIGLLERLGAAHPELRSASHGVELLRQVLVGRRCLLVVDDVWSAAAAAAFRAAGPAGRVAAAGQRRRRRHSATVGRAQARTSLPAKDRDPRGSAHLGTPRHHSGRTQEPLASGDHRPHPQPAGQSKAAPAEDARLATITCHHSGSPAGDAVGSIGHEPRHRPE